MRLNGVARTALAAVCGATVVIASVLLGGPTAHADALSDAEAQLQQLSDQTDQLEANYADSELRMQAAQTQQTQLNDEIAAQQATLDALKPAIAYMVTMERQGTSMDMVTSFLFNNSADEFVSNMSTVASVNTLLDEQVARYVSEQQRLNDLDTTLQSTIAQIQSEKDQQQQLLAQSQAKQLAAQQLVNRLTAAQKAALAASREGIGVTSSGGDAGAKGGASTGSASAPAGEFIWPVSNFIVTSPFGWRVQPIYGTAEFHTGMDLAKPCGTPIVASADGIVTFAGWNGGFGNYTEITTGSLRTGYAHQSKIFVKVGQQVKQGQTIGNVGTTGLSTGCHVHFQVINAQGQYINPTSVVH